MGNSTLLNAFLTPGLMRSVPRDYPDFFYWEDDWNGAGSIDPGGHNPSNYANISIPEGETYNGFTVFFRNNLGTNREYEHLTPAERTFYGLDIGSDEAYRTGPDSFTHVSMALSALALDLVTEWNHDATFSYVDRWVFGEGESAEDAFINDMWDAYRGDYQSFPYLA
jgi:hypothetical protein